MHALRLAGLAAFTAFVVAVSGYALHRNDQPYVVPADVTVTAAPMSAGTQAVFIGDSYTQGKGASSPATKWVTLVAKHEKWDAIDLGRGGTGYVTSSDPSNCGLDACPAYPAMIATAEQYSPNVIVVAGGQNDFAAYKADPAGVAHSVTVFYKTLRQAFPYATIYAVGPSTPEPTVTPTVTAFSAAVQKAATAVNATFINLISPDVINQADLIADGQHVDDAGHAAIATRVERGIGG